MSTIRVACLAVYRVLRKSTALLGALCPILSRSTFCPFENNDNERIGPHARAPHCTRTRCVRRARLTFAARHRAC